MGGGCIKGGGGGGATNTMHVFLAACCVGAIDSFETAIERSKVVLDPENTATGGVAFFESKSTTVQLTEGKQVQRISYTVDSVKKALTQYGWAVNNDEPLVPVYGAGPGIGVNLVPMHRANDNYAFDLSEGTVLWNNVKDIMGQWPVKNPKDKEEYVCLTMGGLVALEAEKVYAGGHTVETEMKIAQGLIDPSSSQGFYLCKKDKDCTQESGQLRATGVQNNNDGGWSYTILFGDGFLCDEVDCCGSGTWNNGDALYSSTAGECSDDNPLHHLRMYMDPTNSPPLKPEKTLNTLGYRGTARAPVPYGISDKSETQFAQMTKAMGRDAFGRLNLRPVDPTTGDQGATVYNHNPGPIVSSLGTSWLAKQNVPLLSLRLYFCDGVSGARTTPQSDINKQPTEATMQKMLEAVPDTLGMKVVFPMRLETTESFMADEEMGLVQKDGLAWAGVGLGIANTVCLAVVVGMMCNWNSCGQKLGFISLAGFSEVSTFQM